MTNKDKNAKTVDAQSHFWGVNKLRAAQEIYDWHRRIINAQKGNWRLMSEKETIQGYLGWIVKDMQLIVIHTCNTEDCEFVTHDFYGTMHSYPFKIGEGVEQPAHITLTLFGRYDKMRKILPNVREATFDDLISNGILCYPKFLWNRVNDYIELKAMMEVGVRKVYGGTEAHIYKWIKPDTDIIEELVFKIFGKDLVNEYINAYLPLAILEEKSEIERDFEAREKLEKDIERERIIAGEKIARILATKLPHTGVISFVVTIKTKEDFYKFILALTTGNLKWFKKYAEKNFIKKGNEEFVSALGLIDWYIKELSK